MIIRLTDAQAEPHDSDAFRDHGRAKALGWMRTGYMPRGGEDERLELRIAAYRAEAAFAIHRGVQFDRDPNGFHAPDVDGFSVRYGARPSYGLVTHRGDPDAPYVLLVPVDDRRSSGLVFRIAGYCAFEDAVAMRDAGIGRALPGTTDPWLISQRLLQPVLAVRVAS